ncbi:PREDICTED: S-type anion channel SLAH4-like [Nicotiana attenuata]|uniref:S-type anion channel slah1 n=1 Tax=Nicotiana attenuata TaxID=49451 RepID=A0A1J6JUY0_NICAT|nr:PREDICTED: S-type anion channel SLAH4-like [Nicotiana attenuata]OIT21549.1 s-type anion channel slah1 [Nicotiana attenuata]
MSMRITPALDDFHTPNTDTENQNTIIPDIMIELPRSSSSGAFIGLRFMLSSMLTRIHAGYFRISLSLCWETLLWKTLLDPTNNETKFLHHVPQMIYRPVLIFLWSFALLVLVLLSLLYLLKCFFRFNLVKGEFLHHVGVNYLFAPWISWLILLESHPFIAPKHVGFKALWWVFAVPVIVLDVKIYGQWFTKGKRLLTAVANPTSHLSVIGNLVGARAAAKMGWQEVSVCLFSLGMVHYLVLFVTLYQRLSGSDRLPAMLRPVFFLFFAAPSMASLAWASITGSFDTASKMLFFFSLFLFTSLICRPTLFKKSMRKFNVAWWAYSYPVTLLALASTRYAKEVKGKVPHTIMLILSSLSILVIIALLLSTALYSKMLLPDEDPSLTAKLPKQSSRIV